MDHAENQPAKRGYVVELTFLPHDKIPGHVHMLGASICEDQPWVYPTLKEAKQAVGYTDDKKCSARVLPCLYYPVVVCYPGDPGDPIRQAITEKFAAGETR